MSTVINSGQPNNKWNYMSAYAIAVKHGFRGTEEEWLEDVYGGAARADADAERTEAARIAAEGSAEDSEAWAVGTRDGEDVPETDPAYHNSAAYHAGLAADSAEDASESAEAAAASEAAAKDYSDHIADPVAGIVSDWLDTHVNPDTGYVIDESLTVSGAAADAAKTGELKSATDDLKTQITDITGNEQIKMTDGAYYPLNGASITIGSPTSNDSQKYALVSCSEGDIFTVSAQGGSSARPWGFVDSTGAILSVSDTTVKNNVIKAPEGAAYLVLNNRKSSSDSSYYGEYLISKVTKATSDINNLYSYNDNEIECLTDGILFLPYGSLINGSISNAGAPSYNNEYKYRLFCDKTFCFSFEIKLLLKSGYAYRFFYYSNAEMKSDSLLSYETITEESDIWYTIPANTFFSLYINRYPTDTSDVFTPSDGKRLIQIDNLISEMNNAIKPINLKIPEYYKTHIEDKAKAINDIINQNEYPTTGTKPEEIDQFVFFSDYHYDKGGTADDNTQHSNALIRYIMNHTGCSFVCHGGDVINNSNSQELAIENLNDFREKFYDMRYDLYCCIGNHEYNSDERLTFAQIHGILNSRIEHRMASLDDCGDYFIDIPARKIRYFFMGCDKRSASASKPWMNNSQLEWLFDNMKTIPDGWGAVLLIHTMLEIVLDAQNEEITIELYNVGTANGKSIADGIDAYNAREQHTFNGITYDYTNCSGTFIAVFSGHSHYDAEYITQGGLPIIMTTTDNCLKRRTGYDWTNQTWLYECTPGTVEEQAFDVITIDKARKKIFLIRVGYGENRDYDFPSAD